MHAPPRFEKFVSPNGGERATQQRATRGRSRGRSQSDGGLSQVGNAARGIHIEPMTRALKRIIWKQQAMAMPGAIPAAPVNSAAAHVILREAAGDYIPIVLLVAKG